MPTPLTPPARSDQPPGRRGAGCLWALGALVALVALLVGGTAVHDVVRTRQRTAAAQVQVDAAYTEVRPAADRRRQSGDAALSTVLGPVVLRSSVLQCTLDEDYAGFNVLRWNQFCVLRTIDAYRPDLPVPALTARLDEAAAADGRSPVQLGSAAGASLTKGCGVLRGHTEDAGGPDGWSVVVSRLAARGFDPLDVDGTRGSCHPPRQAYDVQRNEVEQAYDPAALDAAHTWVVVERRELVVTLDLGCGGLLCDLPTSGVVMPQR